MCQFPISDGFIVSLIIDDEVCEAVINATCLQYLVIYVEVKEIINEEMKVCNIEEHQIPLVRTEYVTPTSQLTSQTKNALEIFKYVQ